MTLIKPVVTYNLETWTMRKIDENALLVFKRKVLKNIYGPYIDKLQVNGEYVKIRN